MFQFSQSKNPVVENAQQTKVSVYVRNCLLSFAEEFKGRYGEAIDLQNEECLKKFLAMVQERARINLKQEINGKYEYSEPNTVKLTYTPSNLGHGFIIWFVCNSCGRKVRTLYIPPNNPISACRTCHHLRYQKQNKTRDKLVSRLIANPDLRLRYLNSGSHRLALAAIEAQWIVNQGIEEAEKRVDKLFPKEK